MNRFSIPALCLAVLCLFALACTADAHDYDYGVRFVEVRDGFRRRVLVPVATNDALLGGSVRAVDLRTGRVVFLPRHLGDPFRSTPATIVVNGRRLLIFP